MVMPEDTIQGFTDAAPAVVVQDAAPPAPDWNAELEWARSQYPALKGYELEVPVKALLEWVPPDKTVPLFVRLRKLECKPASATRKADESHIELTVITKDAGKIREYTNGQAGEVLRYGFGGGTQKVNADGTTEETAGWGASDTGNEGILSSVEGNVARFDAEAVKAVASCGPIEKLPCGDSGTHDCNRCTQVTIDYQPRVLGMGRAMGATIDSCRESCPKADNPSFDRLVRVLAEKDTGWRLTTEGPPARLYKTLAACKADKSKRGK